MILHQDKLMRPREVAKRLATSQSTIYRWFHDGTIKGVQIAGGTLRILESEVNRIEQEARED